MWQGLGWRPCVVDLRRDGAHEGGGLLERLPAGGVEGDVLEELREEERVPARGVHTIT